MTRINLRNILEACHGDKSLLDRERNTVVVLTHEIGTWEVAVRRVAEP